MADNIHYTELRAEHKNEVVDMLVQYFTYDEPTNRAVNLRPEESLKCFEDFVDDGVRDNCSYVAIDKLSGKVVGCRLNNLYRPYTSDMKNLTYPQKHLYVLHFLDELASEVSQLIPEALKILKFNAVHVDQNYRRLGIAKRLVDLSLEHAKSAGFDYVIATATSFKTQAMFEKIGFLTLKEVKYADYTVDGKKIFENMPAEEISAKLMALSLM